MAVALTQGNVRGSGRHGAGPDEIKASYVGGVLLDKTGARDACPNCDAVVVVDRAKYAPILSSFLVRIMMDTRYGDGGSQLLTCDMVANSKDTSLSFASARGLRRRSAMDVFQKLPSRAFEVLAQRIDVAGRGVVAEGVGDSVECRARDPRFLGHLIESDPSGLSEGLVVQ